MHPHLQMLLHVEGPSHQPPDHRKKHVPGSEPADALRLDLRPQQWRMEDRFHAAQTEAWLNHHGRSQQGAALGRRKGVPGE